MKMSMLSLIVACWLSQPVSAQVFAQLEQFLPRGQIAPRVQNELLAPQEQEDTTQVTRREASDLARGAYPGRVLSIRLEGRHWRVRMDEEGTVFNVFVDADNGQVLRPSE